MSSSDSNLTPPATGLIAGKYELVQLIGRGGMGSVWEGRHASLGTKVAIKFIEAEYADSADARARFDNEAKAAATIQSKHAIQIYDHGMTADGRPYIVMEMLEGEPLDKRLKNVTRLSMQETARIIQQVCRALHRAHERGIIHRDLKPENIFLVRNSDDDDEIAKVLDFGIAKMRAAPGAVGVSSSTKTGTLLGTPFYMSPEQARGLRNVDHRSDLWSLGVIVFKCVTGDLPFDGESLGDLLVKICTVPIPVPSHVMPGLGPQFDAWLLRALDREPANRFQTAQELADGLAYACGVSVRRSGPSSRTPDPGGARMPTPMRSATPSGEAFASSGIPAATSAPFTKPSPGPGGSSVGKYAGIVGVAVVCLAIGAFVVLKTMGGSSGDKPNHASASAGAAIAAPPTLPNEAPSASAAVPTVAAADLPPASAAAATLARPPKPSAPWTGAKPTTPKPPSRPPQLPAGVAPQNPPAKPALPSGDPGY